MRFDQVLLGQIRQLRAEMTRVHLVMPGEIGLFDDDGELLVGNNGRLEGLILSPETEHPQAWTLDALALWLMGRQTWRTFHDLIPSYSQGRFFSKREPRLWRDAAPRTLDSLSSLYGFGGREAVLRVLGAMETALEVRAKMIQTAGHKTEKKKIKFGNLEEPLVIGRAPRGRGAAMLVEEPPDGPE